jgi:hypothetical protein
MQCSRCHRVRASVYPHVHRCADPQLVLQPPPEYVEFGLPAYEELFPDLGNVKKETNDESLSTIGSSTARERRFSTVNS